MTEILPMLYLLAMVSLLVVALRLMWFNVSQINKMMNEPVKVRHPELENVKDGDAVSYTHLTLPTKA